MTEISDPKGFPTALSKELPSGYKGGMAKLADRASQLREFIKENDQRLYDFCYWGTGGNAESEDLVLSIFREFGEQFFRDPGLEDARTANQKWRIRLFQLASRRLREAMWSQPWLGGRDTRQLQSLEKDLLADWKRDRDFGAMKPVFLDRLMSVDADWLVPVVLKDILKFEHEEVVEILGVRWGVYRHRLHRGRLELVEAFHGAKGTVLEKNG